MHVFLQLANEPVLIGGQWVFTKRLGNGQIIRKRGRIEKIEAPDAHTLQITCKGVERYFSQRGRWERIQAIARNRICVIKRHPDSARGFFKLRNDGSAVREMHSDDPPYSLLSCIELYPATHTSVQK